MAELQLRAEVVHVAIDREPDPERASQQRAAFALIADPHVVAHGPLAVGTLEMLEHRALDRIVDERGQRAAALIVILAGQIHHRLAFHVGLPGQDEHLHRALAGLLEGFASSTRRGQDGFTEHG